MVTNRRSQLLDFVAQNPDNAFARYGLAMDMVQAGETDPALEQFRLLQSQHPDYVAGFQQAGQLLLQLDRREEARSHLEAGLAAATRTGNRHAGSEIQGLLDELG